MKELSFYYSFRICFSDPVKDHRFTLRCVPRDSGRQKIKQMEITVFPKENLSSSIDSFGNYCIYGDCRSEHDLFMAEVKGIAKTGLAGAEYAGEDYRMGRYRYQSACTQAGEAIRGFHGKLPLSGEMSNLQKALCMMEALYENFEYVQGVTTVRTTAEEAMALGKGVCQDYAHILISLCRMEGIPARYVVGMMVGEGASHAWVEIYHEGYWIALDPTNRLVVDDQHIKISGGRDYQDCVINQGIMVGLTRQTQEIEVLVEEIREE